MEELKFVAKGGNTKTVRHRKSESVESRSRHSISSEQSNRSKESDDKKYLESSNKV